MRRQNIVYQHGARLRAFSPLLACLILIGTQIAFPLAFSADASEEAVHVLFDEEFSWLTQEGADRFLQRAQEAGFDTVVPCVWHGRGVTWPSELAPREPRWEATLDQNPDPLGYLIRKAHVLGIKVHPWFTVGLRQRDFFPEFAEPGTPEKSFNWHHPGFQDWMVNLILEVVQTYEIDGLNLDYVRTKGHCTTPSCEQLYKATRDRNLRRDTTLKRFDQAARDSLMSWNSHAVGSLVERLANEGRRIRPGLIITIDSLAGDQLWMEQGANGLVWAQKGWIDLIYHMDYGNPLNAVFLTQLRGKVIDRSKVAILIGNYKINPANPALPIARSSGQVLQLIEQSRQLWPESSVTALYEYRFLTDDQIAALRSGPFKPSDLNGKKLLAPPTIKIH
ncbi:MAG: family 10 glycosylhydrolase [Nitrospira sp.]|nr:family 10 glycosylhydrolase [Nitrospira sp.]